MKLNFDKNRLNSNPAQLLRQAGYIYIIDRRSGEESYVRRLGRGFYPRFHLYLDDKGGQTFLNLHLDQKQPSYQGASAHNAEYDGELVEKEMQRIEKLIMYNL
ncbi:MAG: hypothetical protein V1667_00455 [bacterium]